MSIKEVDARNFDSQDKYSVLLNTFDSLDMGERMVLVNNNDLSPLFNQLHEEARNKYEWEYLEEGPDIWKVSVQKKYLSFI